MDDQLPSPARFRGYLLWLSVALAGLALLLLGSLYAFRKQLPPPPFTGSISFDEKAVWLADRLDRDCDLLAVGSSMTVNNLDSAVFDQKAFLNASSWGMKMQHTEYFLDTLLELVSPKTVLVITAPIDFERDYRDRAFYDRAKLVEFLESRDLFCSHLQYLSIGYLLEGLPGVLRDRVGRGTYYALDFDAGGSVPLDLVTEGFERLDDRWDRPIAQAEGIDEVNYESLAAMARKCHERSIRFVLVQAPIREGVLGEVDRVFLHENHWPRLERLCAENGAAFYNFHGRLRLSEGDFADSTHLSRAGAGKLSRALLGALEAPASSVTQRSSGGALE